MTLLLAASVIPPLFLLWKVYQMDQIEKEPPKLLLTIFILGMISTIPAGLLEMVGQAILVSILPEDFLATSFGTTVANLLMYLIVVGGVRCRKIDFFDTLPELRKRCPTMRIIYFFGRRLTDETEQTVTGLLTSRADLMDIQTGKTPLTEAEAFLNREPTLRMEMDESLAELYQVCPGTASIYRLEPVDGRNAAFTLYADRDGVVQYIKLALE